LNHRCACVTVRHSQISRSWTPGPKLPTINTAFLYLEAWTSPSDVQSQRCTIRNGNALLTYTANDGDLRLSEQFSRGTGRKHPCSEPRASCTALGDASERPSAFSELHRRVPACRAAMRWSGPKRRFSPPRHGLI
jgi:hypothetical protein